MWFGKHTLCIFIISLGIFILLTHCRLHPTKSISQLWHESNDSGLLQRSVGINQLTGNYSSSDLLPKTVASFKSKLFAKPAEYWKDFKL